MRDYLAQLGFSTIAVLMLVAGINLVVNAYGWLDVPTIPGINEFPLGLNRRLPLGRALAVSRLQPRAIILGNSRAESGYEPGNWPAASGPAYNLAIGGAGIGMVARYAREAMESGRLREMVLALDFSMFDPAFLNQRIDESALMTEPDGRRRDAWRALQRTAVALLSGTALSDSWWSLTHQRRPVVRYTPSGRRDETADLDQVMREGGHREASLRTELGFASAGRRLGTMDPLAARAGMQRAMDELVRVLVAARDRGVRVTLVINPIHARQNYVLMGAGAWHAHEEWKRDLASVASGNGAVAWDFSGVSACTSEELPGKGDVGTRMRWYRETSHFRAALGDKVLARISGNADDRECPGFGVKLLPESVDAILVDQRKRLLEWAATHAADVRELANLGMASGIGGSEP